MSVSQSRDGPGPIVSDTKPSPLPSSSIVLASNLSAKHVNSVTLVPTVEAHLEDLYPVMGGAENYHIYHYTIGEPPGDDLASYLKEWKELLGTKGIYLWTVFKRPTASETPANNGDGDNDSGTPLGLIILGEAAPEHRRIELGLFYSSPLQRTTAGTEALYLLIKYVFDDLNYRKLEWRTNDLNEASKRAAMRLGLSQEGLFKYHQISRGRSRDTAAFGIIDDDWVFAKPAFETWLSVDNFDGEGKQKRRLEDIRKELRAAGGKDGS